MASIGLVLDAGDTVEPRTMTVTTDTPGFTAEIQAGDSPQGPWEPVSQSRTIQNRHRYTLENAEALLPGLDHRGRLGLKHVNEVHGASTRTSELELAAPLVPFQRELDEPVEELQVESRTPRRASRRRSSP